jgi:hypothetical protein
LLFTIGLNKKKYQFIVRNASAFPQWQPLGVAGIFLLSTMLLVTACSDDPILGPDDGKPDDSGGSYSVIKRLAPPDTGASADTARTASPPPPGSNPERF